MKVIELSFPLNPVESFVPSSVSVGYFDGVHTGHQSVIKTGINIAKRNALFSSVMTFHPHPKEILGKKGYTQYITPIQDKLELFKNMGVDIVYLVRFDKHFSTVSQIDFIEKFIIPLQIRHVTVGFDFRFGSGGNGTPEFMQQKSDGRYGVSIIQPVKEFGEKISSTAIRHHLSEGDFRSVNKLLGRVYRIKGEVVKIESIHVPQSTILKIKAANSYLIPKEGIYTVYRNESEYPDTLKVINNDENQMLELYVNNLNENPKNNDFLLDLYFIKSIIGFGSSTTHLVELGEIVKV